MSIAFGQIYSDDDGFYQQPNEGDTMEESKKSEIEDGLKQELALQKALDAVEELGEVCPHYAHQLKVIRSQISRMHFSKPGGLPK
jgi:hypothetical protein